MTGREIHPLEHLIRKTFRLTVLLVICCVSLYAIIYRHDDDLVMFLALSSFALSQFVAWQILSGKEPSDEQ
mgnify:CR=1 FL=1